MDPNSQAPAEPPPQDTPEPQAAGQAPSQAEAPAAFDVALRPFIVAAMTLGFGVWCVIDAYVRNLYPYSKYEESGNINDYMSFAFNHYAPFVLIPIGLLALVYGIVLLQRKAVADEQGLFKTGHDKIAWNQITRLDASKLASDKSLVIHHGQGQTLVLHGRDHRNFADLVAVIDRYVPEDKRTT